MYPPNVYSKSYLLPKDDRCWNTIDILMSVKWEDKLMSALFSDVQIKKAKYSEAVINNKPTWEYLTCNMNKLLEIYKLIDKGVTNSITLVVYDWQIPYIDSVLKKTNAKISYIPVDDAMQAEIMQRLE